MTLHLHFKLVYFIFTQLRRHEIHKSKNKALALLELQEKAQRRKWKKQKQLAPDSLEKRKLALMHEVRAKSVLSACYKGFAVVVESCFCTSVKVCSSFCIVGLHMCILSFSSTCSSWNRPCNNLAVQLEYFVHVDFLCTL